MFHWIGYYQQYFMTLWTWYDGVAFSVWVNTQCSCTFSRQQPHWKVKEKFINLSITKCWWEVDPCTVAVANGKKMQYLQKYRKTRLRDSFPIFCYCTKMFCDPRNFGNHSPPLPLTYVWIHLEWNSWKDSQGRHFTFNLL